MAFDNRFIQLLYHPGCMDGFIGINCNVHCPLPSYGQGCQLECSCQPNDCHHVLVVYGQNLVTGKENKIKRLHIWKKCIIIIAHRLYMYIHCNQKSDKTIYFFTYCVKGKQGNFCKKCRPYPNYGKKCQLFCKCKSQFCNLANGCLSSLIII